MNILWDYIGLTGFQECFDLQTAIRESVLCDGAPSRVILTEHKKVITLGRRESGGNILFSEEFLIGQGYEVVKTTRGGLATYHGPGQLVIYPILDLKAMHLKVKEYVRRLELSVIDMLAKHSIEAVRKEGFPGVWIDSKKIGSLGIHVKKLVTMHGFALNVYTDLKDFSVINPCGFEKLELTSMEAEGAKGLTLEKAGSAFIDSFSRIFQVNCERVKVSLGQK